LPALLRAEEVAEILSVDREWVVRNFRAGKIRLGHKTSRWRKSDVFAFLKGLGAGA
jgi:predicted DNA-binding transcriptional regulator AlpA